VGIALLFDEQARLLRFVEEHRFERVGGMRTITIDARIIAATSRDLEIDAAAGQFRRDLLFRLGVIIVRLPPLREHMEDLPMLTEHVLRCLSIRHERKPFRLTADAEHILRTYSWPGNVREFINTLEHAVVMTRGDMICAEDLPDRLRARTGVRVRTAQPESRLTLRQLERRSIEQVLAESGTLDEAARRLGINPTTLWRKRKRYGMA
jgi:NtrC-family two-component system response regulator AlgB